MCSVCPLIATSNGQVGVCSGAFAWLVLTKLINRHTIRRAASGQSALETGSTSADMAGNPRRKPAATTVPSELHDGAVHVVSCCSSIYRHIIRLANIITPCTALRRRARTACTYQSGPPRTRAVARRSWCSSTAGDSSRGPSVCFSTMAVTWHHSKMSSSSP